MKIINKNISVLISFFLITMFFILQYSNQVKYGLVNAFGNQKSIIILSLSFLIISIFFAFYICIRTFIKQRKIHFIGLILLIASIWLIINKIWW